MPVEKGGQVPAAGEPGHLVRADVGELGGPAEVDRETSLDEVADRRRGHPRPENRQRLPEGLRQPVRRHPCTDRALQGRAHLLRVGGLHHRPRPQPRTGICRRDQTRTRGPPPGRQRHPQPARGLPLAVHRTQLLREVSSGEATGHCVPGRRVMYRNRGPRGRRKLGLARSPQAPGCPPTVVRDPWADLLQVGAHPPVHAFGE